MNGLSPAFRGFTLLGGPPGTGPFTGSHSLINPPGPWYDTASFFQTSTRDPQGYSGTNGVDERFNSGLLGKVQSFLFFSVASIF